MNLFFILTNQYSTELVAKYLSLNEKDYFKVGDNQFFVLSERYPNDVFLNCKNFLALADFKFHKSALKISKLLNSNVTEGEFFLLKSSLLE